MQMTRSPTLQLKKPACIICDAEGDDRCGQCEKVLFRICWIVFTSTKILIIEFSTYVLVFILFHGCSTMSDAEDNAKELFVVCFMIVADDNIDKTYGHVGLRSLWIVNGFISGAKPDTSSPHESQRAASPLYVYLNPAACIAI
jgi:hypothetical protein